MRVHRKALLFSTILQASTFAWADPMLSQNSRKMEPPKSVTGPTSKINYFDLHLPSEREMREQQPSSAEHQIFSTKAKDSSLNVAPANSLHLTQSEQRPSLEYHISDKNTVRFHIGVHGANASTSWGF